MKPMQLVGGEPRWGTLATYYEPAPADASSLDRGNPGRRVHSPRRWRNLPANALASVSFFGRTQCRDRDCDVAKTGLHLRLTAMKVSGDRDAPLFDLSALSDQGL